MNSPNPPPRKQRDGTDSRAVTPFLLLSTLILSSLYFVFGTYHNRPYKIEGDGKYYYQYLVSFLYDGDLDFTNNYRTPKPPWMRDEIDNYELRNDVDHRTGRPRNLWTCGPAVLWAPFFAVAYGMGRILDAAVNAGIGTDPWSRYYQYFVMYSAVVYCAASMWLMIDILRRHVGSNAAMCSVAIIVFGTNVWYYAVFEPSYSHVYDLFTFSLYFWFLLRLCDGRWSLGGGASAGLAGALHCLVRTQNLATVAVFSAALFWVGVRHAVDTRRTPVARCLSGYLLLLSVGLTPIFLVNAYLSGDPFGPPQGSAFLDLSRPHVLALLFSSRNGLFNSHPILLPAAIGFIGFVVHSFTIGRVGSLPYVALGVAACAQIYINSAVIDWWGGIAFGQRRLVSSYLPFAFGLAYIWGRWISKPWRKRAWMALCLFLVAASIYMALVHVFSNRWSENRYETITIERKFVEPGVGLRLPPGQGLHHAVAPLCDIPLTWRDPDLVAEERQEVEYYTDDLGFTNRVVPDKADVIVIGDSFTQVADVPWDQRWVRILEDSTGLSVYNISQGGYCPTQEVELYARYGNISGVRLALLGVYGINDISDERKFAHFVESGLGPREWAYRKARKVFPEPTPGFIQIVQRWCVKQGAPRKDATQLELISVTNTQPSTVVSYHPDYQVRAWQCVYLEPRRSPGVQSIEASIARLAEMCRTQGRRAGVLYFPIKQTIHPPDPDDQEPWVAFLKRTLPWIEPEGWDREKIVMAGRLLLQGDRRLEAHLASVCDSLGVLFHSTIPTLEREVKTSHGLTYYRFDTHWNTRGNEAVGRDVAAWVDSIWEG